MYEQHFGLRRRPFPVTPDSALYYPATGHECALAPLLRAINEDEGLALLTGPPGMGKTLLGHCLLERLGPNVTSAFLTNSHFSDRSALLQAILYDLSLPYELAAEQVLRLRLTDFLLQNCANGRRAVLFVDEAHHLSRDHLEELRLLGNLEAGQGKAFQVILAGQTSLIDTLAQPELTSFNQRLQVRVCLPPLGFEEAVDYIVHHFRLAGGKAEDLIDEPSLEILARETRGVPRLLNQAVHQAMMLAHGADMNQVDSEAALEALNLLGLEGEKSEPSHGESQDPVDEGDAEKSLAILGAEYDRDAIPIHSFESSRSA